MDEGCLRDGHFFTTFMKNKVLRVYDPPPTLREERFYLENSENDKSSILNQPPFRMPIQGKDLIQKGAIAKDPTFKVDLCDRNWNTSSNSGTHYSGCHSPRFFHKQTLADYAIFYASKT
ncbi:13370_t:CDS:2 [Ambispora leptoticha]|uniref:13370_t:CDS:1 n=1 Tax=Ambispora leptoticha TaxID=144679 RepID=A0A9N8YVX0_9GLOM|nr:13370_t:CDS:2 [Ambispora leptoticha]